MRALSLWPMSIKHTHLLSLLSTLLNTLLQLAQLLLWYRGVCLGMILPCMGCFLLLPGCVIVFLRILHLSGWVMQRKSLLWPQRSSICQREHSNISCQSVAIASGQPNWNANLVFSQPCSKGNRYLQKIYFSANLPWKNTKPVTKAFITKEGSYKTNTPTSYPSPSIPCKHHLDHPHPFFPIHTLLTSFIFFTQGFWALRNPSSASFVSLKPPIICLW